jgi:hypothetical protein
LHLYIRFADRFVLALKNGIKHPCDMKTAVTIFTTETYPEGGDRRFLRKTENYLPHYMA